MNYYVYMIIENHVKRKISYVGYTNDLSKRLNAHNSSKGAKFTKGRKWKLIYYKQYKDKKLAMREEYKLKKNIKLRNKIKNSYNT